MTQSVRIENELLRVEVWPRLGGKVSSIIDKTDGYELLFNFPAEIPTECMYGRPYDSSWYAGWDECFPAVGAGPYVGHPYDHTSIPDHGEVYAIPTTSVPTRDGITTVWHGLRFGYRMTRRLSLNARGLRAEYSAVNLAPFEFRFVWAQHALMSVESPVEFDLPMGAPMRWSHSPSRDVQQPFDWPKVAADADLSRPAQLPVDGGWKVFSLDPISRPAVIHFPQRKRKLEISYHSETVAAYWGLWANTGAWNHQQHLAMEPTTGRYDQLDRAIADNSAARIPPLSTVEWVTEWNLSAQ